MWVRVTRVGGIVEDGGYNSRSVVAVLNAVGVGQGVYRIKLFARWWRRDGTDRLAGG